MEEGASSNKDEEMDADERGTNPEKAEDEEASHTVEDVSEDDATKEEEDEVKQRRQMRRLMRMLAHGDRPGQCGMGQPRGMGMRGPAAAWAIPSYYGPPSMGPASFVGLPPRFMRR